MQLREVFHIFFVGLLIWVIDACTTAMNQFTEVTGDSRSSGGLSEPGTQCGDRTHYCSCYMNPLPISQNNTAFIWLHSRKTMWHQKWRASFSKTILLLVCCQLDTNLDMSGKKKVNWKSAPSDFLQQVCNTDWCQKAQLTERCNPEQIALGYIGMHAEHIIRNTSVSITRPWLLLQILPPGSYLEFVSWISSMAWNKSYISQTNLFFSM